MQARAACLPGRSRLRRRFVVCKRKQGLELNNENIEKVLEEIRPYLSGARVACTLASGLRFECVLLVYSRGRLDWRG